MGIITLLSDLGLQDASVASAKGILMQELPGANVVDISHFVEPFHIRQAAYLLTSAYPNFGPDTVHIVLCDIFSEKQPTMLLAEKAGQYFLAPDNGVLSLAFGRELDTVWTYPELSQPTGFHSWVRAAAKIAAMLQDQPASALSFASHELRHASQHWQPHISGDAVECHVIHIDRYENVVINITRKQFDSIGRGRPFRIQMMRDEEITEISQYYYEVREGEKLCRFNTAGYLEIAINKGNAASLLGFRLYSDKHVIYNTIKISFE